MNAKWQWILWIQAYCFALLVDHLQMQSLSRGVIPAIVSFAYEAAAVRGSQKGCPGGVAHKSWLEEKDPMSHLR